MTSIEFALLLVLLLVSKPSEHTQQHTLLLSPSPNICSPSKFTPQPPSSGTTWTQALLHEAVGIKESFFKKEGGRAVAKVACNNTTNRYCRYYYQDSRALDKAVGKPRRMPAIIKVHRAPRCFEEASCAGGGETTTILLPTFRKKSTGIP